MARIDDENHFRQFATNLEFALQKYEENQEDSLLAHQRTQLRKLVALEEQLRLTIIDHPWGENVYKDFVKHICETKRNILAARPYFRERQTTFTRRISGALKRKRDKELYQFKFNWSFIAFVLKSRKWPAGGKIASLARQIDRLRQEILEQNLPLAISQARIFWSNTPKSHLSYMDIVQIQCQGLLLAIDKFVPPNDKRMSNRKSLEGFRKFRAVAIGIMARDRVNMYSETLIHYYPKDKMKIYRALKALRRFSDLENKFEKVAEIVNVDLPVEDQTNPDEIASLISAASTVSADFSPDPEGDTVIDTFAAEEATRPDVMVEEHQATNTVLAHAKELHLRERKMLKMKGIKL